MTIRRLPLLALLAASALAPACSSDATAVTPVTSGDAGAVDASTADTGAAPEAGDAAVNPVIAQIPQAMHDALAGDLATLEQASNDILNAAPTPADRGWDNAQDAAAITAMKAAWKRARTAYEHVEGATAPKFADLDYTIDARYDDFLGQLAETAPAGSKDLDDDLFDDTGVTGLHAVERILYAQDSVPASVVTFESSLQGYVKAAYPATAAQAAEFKAKLCAKLVADAHSLRVKWQPQDIDVSSSFQGLVSLMNEQKEKVSKAATGQEESRYSQRTMDDLRDNLTGTINIYGLFKAAILQAGTSTDLTKDGAALNGTIEAGFQSLQGIYATYTGDALPTPPATWSSVAPTPADLATPFGKLYEAVLGAVDPNAASSVVSQMNDAANLLGYPIFIPGE